MANKNKEENCKHVFKYAGHNHSWSVYECTKCGKLEERAQ